MPGWRNWQTRQLEGLVLRTRGAGSIPVPGIELGKASCGRKECAGGNETKVFARYEK
jgi:hypothetical protein